MSGSSLDAAVDRGVAHPGAGDLPAVRLEPGPDGILYLTFDQPGKKVNVITFEVLSLLDRLLDEISRASDARAVIARSQKPDCFLAGADVEAIAAVRNRDEAMEASRLGQRVFAKVETLRIPVVAAVDGVCLGGGAEFALSCHFRLLSARPSTRLGFPEVRLGILPAWGGTQRLPQIVGIRRALDLILTGRSIDPRRAHRMGLADEVLPPELFAEQVLAFTQKVVADERGPRRARPKLSFTERLLESTGIGRGILFAKAMDQIVATAHGHYPAPPTALDAVRVGVERGNRAGYVVEARGAAELITGAVSRNLIGLFFLTEAVKKSRGVPQRDVEPHAVRELGILGAGIMGGGIAHAAISADLPVRLRDVKHEAILGALAHVRELHDQAVDRRRLDRRAAERRLALISPTLDDKGFGRADLVVEAVVEDMGVKQKVLGQLEAAVRPECILASNTSSLSITSMGALLARPERFLGLHFFNPVHRMPLVEVIRGEHTGDEAVVTAFELAKRLGKTPIVVADRPGFLVNRILMPYLSEACLLLEEGLPVEVIDRALVNFGMPMGPLELLDEIGLDVAVRASRSFAAAFGDSVRPTPVLEALVARGRLGRKGGAGFYRWGGGGRRPDPELDDILDALPRAGVAGDGAPHPGGEASEYVVNLQERLILPMINEAALCVAEGVVRRPVDVDLGMVLGTGFPPFRGGLLRYADALDLGAVVDRLDARAAEAGPRYAPAPLLVEMARQGRRFYPDR